MSTQDMMLLYRRFEFIEEKLRDTNGNLDKMWAKVDDLQGGFYRSKVSRINLEKWPMHHRSQGNNDLSFVDSYECFVN
jgi:hypothetical protein